MKQKLIALSVAATLGLAAGAATAAPQVQVNGIGTINVIPYFSTQGNNVTQIAITNTDVVRGKAVKVRFRGAEWSDDIFDFTVFLSPGDVFTAAVTNNNGVSSLTTSDGSCTLPTTINQDFPTQRLTTTSVGGTREGYIEIINMADIYPSGVGAGLALVGVAGSAADGYSLFDAIKHVNGVAPCKSAGKYQTTLTSLVQDNFLVPVAAGLNAAGQSGQDATWMGPPTTGLTSWARIIDIDAVKAYGVPSTAITFTAATSKAYFQQSNDAMANYPAIAADIAAIPAGTSALTVDRIFAAKMGVAWATTGDARLAAGGAGIPMYQFDAPDLSTAYEFATIPTAIAARDGLTAALQKAAVATEYSTLSAVNGATDVVMTQPTRRYYYNYGWITPLAGHVVGTDYSRSIPDAASLNWIVEGDADGAQSPYQTLDFKNRIGLGNLTAAASNAVNGSGLAVVSATGANATPALFFDREEQYQNTPSSIVISPTPPSAGYTISLKGEASVIGFNRGSVTSTGALGGTLTMNNIDVQGGYQSGWMILSTVTRTTNRNLPVIGFSAQNVAGGDNYGTTLPLRYFGGASLISE